MLLNVASPFIIPLLDAPSLNTTVVPVAIVVLFVLELLNIKLVIFTPSTPLTVPDTTPQFMESERVYTPLVAVLNIALPVIVPVLYEVPLNVAFPITLVVLYAVPEKLTPVVLASPVNPVESIIFGSIVAELLIIGETLPTSLASFVAPGTLPMGTSQLLDVYQLLALDQSESVNPHQ